MDDQERVGTDYEEKKNNISFFFLSLSLNSG